MDETESISHSTNTLGKAMNPIILPPAMGKKVVQTGFLSFQTFFVWAFKIVVDSWKFTMLLISIYEKTDQFL